MGNFIVGQIIGMFTLIRWIFGLTLIGPVKGGLFAFLQSIGLVGARGLLAGLQSGAMLSFTSAAGITFLICNGFACVIGITLAAILVYQIPTVQEFIN